MDRPEGFSPRGSSQAVRRRKSGGVSPTQRIRRARTARLSAEKAEYRQYTQATRRRRINWAVSMGSVGLLVMSVVLLTLSPALALREVRVIGNERVSSDLIEQALGGLYGEPLARVSAERISEALAPLTLIQAFETRIEPPGTLVVLINERRPLGVVRDTQSWQVVDAAGVVLWRDGVAPAGLPEILVEADADAPSFRAVSRVLLALPDDLLQQVESVTATTLDDVRFTIRGSSHEVVWGSADRSAEKARVLGASLIALSGESARVIDVTTPESLVVRARG